mmetsp:Transcript_41949/g.118952  ORF Transcript_41949/g.118952 Transcript_41949/m.118952 type:complete len:207 (+) Transcript_41949:1881-2501(+)
MLIPVAVCVLSLLCHGRVAIGGAEAHDVQIIRTQTTQEAINSLANPLPGHWRPRTLPILPGLRGWVWLPHESLRCGNAAGQHQPLPEGRPTLVLDPLADELVPLALELRPAGHRLVVTHVQEVDPIFIDGDIELLNGVPTVDEVLLPDVAGAQAHLAHRHPLALVPLPPAAQPPVPHPQHQVRVLHRTNSLPSIGGVLPSDQLRQP